MKRPLPFFLALALAGAARAESPDEREMGRLLQEELRAHGGDVHGCYGIALAERAGLSGEVLFRIHVATDGGIIRAEVLKDQVNSGRLTDCLIGAIRRWRVPKLAGSATQQLVFPLVFKPEEAAQKPGAKDAGRVVVPLAEGAPGPLPGGKIDARVLIDQLTVGKTNASLTRLTLKQGTRLALHQHPASIEIFYVVKGLARIRDGFGGAQEVAETGDLILHAPGAAHSVEAAPLAPLDLIQIFVPGGPEQAYRDSTNRTGTVAVQKKKARDATFIAAPQIVKAAARKAYPILGGKGTATLLMDQAEIPQASLQRLEADTGATIPQHLHETSDEILFILAGRGELTVAGKIYPVAAGDAIRIPNATLHALVVLEKISAVQCYAPGGPEQRFKAPPSPAATPDTKRRP
ncbi:MAG: cupin domain-containing protein [Myxococcales bacterium]|nr:cupin domain-containing protein [Myxococcales bacterium]